MTRYGPSGSSSPRKRPSASVISERSKLVAVFLIDTVAPGRAAPLGSLTVPSMTPVVAWDWEKASEGASAIRHANSNRREAQRMDTGGLLGKCSDEPMWE